MRTVTLVKARDLEPLMVVQLSGSGASRDGEATVVEIERANDAIDRLREQIGKTSSRPKLTGLVREMERALEAVDCYGRESRLVRFAGHDWPRVFQSQETVRYLRHATATEAGL